MKVLRLFAVVVCLALVALPAIAQVSISGTSHSETFNSIGGGLPAGWTVRTGATASSLGTVATLNTAPVSWGTTTGQFANMAASTDLGASSTSGEQAASANRALGIRQTTFGDPGAAMVVNLNTTGFTISQLSFDLMMLSVQTRSTTWTIDYGLGVSPTSFTSLTTWADPGTFGRTPVSITGSSLAALSNQSSVWIRLVALGATTGSGSRDSIGLDNFSLTHAAIPEPSTNAAVLGALALAATLACRRRKRKPTEAT